MCLLKGFSTPSASSPSSICTLLAVPRFRAWLSTNRETTGAACPSAETKQYLHPFSKPCHPNREIRMSRRLVVSPLLCLAHSLLLYGFEASLPSFSAAKFSNCIPARRASAQNAGTEASSPCSSSHEQNQGSSDTSVPHANSLCPAWTEHCSGVVQEKNLVQRRRKTASGRVHRQRGTKISVD